MLNRQEGRQGLGQISGILAPAALSLAVALTSVALPDSVLAQSYSFSSVSISGNERVDNATVLGTAGIKAGESLSAGQLNEAYQKLQSSGLFEKVDLEPQGSTLKITVQEYPTINVISFEGNQRMKDEALAKIVQSQSRRVYSPATVEADAQLIAEAYAQGGRVNARVEPKVIRRSNNRVDIAFEIKEGKVTEIERISFTGNHAFSDRRLRQVLQTKQAGILRAFIQRDTFVADRVNVDRQLLTDFYRSRGYPDVQVNGVSSEMTRERDAFFMTFNISEGQQFKFGKISTVSEVNGVSADEYSKLSKIRAGAIYTPTAIDLAVTRMEEKARQAGLNFVRVDPRVTRNPRTGTLDVQFALVKGPRIFIERIDIEGNTATLDRVIRREFHSVEGDPYNPREIKRSAERIRALGYFSNADVNTRKGTNDDQVIVDVNVTEQPTGSLTFGASYGASAGFGINASLNERNFLGRGQQLSIGIGTTSDNQTSVISFTEPYLFGRDLAATGRLFYSTTDNDNSDYSTMRAGIQPSIEFPVAENARLKLRYEFSREELSDVDTYDASEATGSSPILSREEGARYKSAVGYTYTFDTTETNIDPRYSYLLRFDQEFAGLGGDVEAVTTTVLGRAQRKVWNDEVTLRAELEGGAIIASSGNTTILDRFTGNGKIRGFESNGIGPRDTAAPNEDALGGKYFAVARLEAQFPLGLPEEYKLGGAVFLDAGSVWGLDDTDGVEEVDDGFHLRSAIGVSLLWDSFIGPLRLNFSKAIVKEDYDEEQNFDLTVSTKF
ncbi:outer membrane protein assembly factor BamA [Thioclava sp. GXIMD4216]|uniref:Outer membrane protein assembly factor BamA n=1 Tax=Thioclava litoralis TaxID=3076557 RepID=A0ABZ1DXU4_9RHOB|nr:outer membrane protein assembly factor BamA [Thioclava sp. FTW29]